MPFVLFLTFNIYRAVPKMLRTDTRGAGVGSLSWWLTCCASGETVEAGGAPGGFPWVGEALTLCRLLPPSFPWLYPLWPIITANGLATEASGA